MKQRAKIIAAALSLTFFAACGGATLQFVTRPQPSPLMGTKKIVLAGVSYDGLMVSDKPLDQYLAEKAAKAEAKGKDDESAEKWAANKEKWQKDVIGILTSELTNAKIDVSQVGSATEAKEGIVVHMNVESIRPGFYAVVAQSPSETIVRVKIIDVSKGETPIYEMTGKASNAGYTTDSRVGNDMTQIATQVADFIKKELAGQS